MNPDDSRTTPFRRTVLAALGGLGAAVGLTGPAAADSHGGDDSQLSSVARLRDRIETELRIRLSNARTQLDTGDSIAPHEFNERLFDDHVVTKFGKGLAHDDGTGLPNAGAYQSLVDAVESGTGYDAIRQGSIDTSVFGGSGVSRPVDPAPVVDEPTDLAPRPLVQPQTAWSRTLTGKSTAMVRIARPPRFDSTQTGAEMVELYWRALARDVPFNDYVRSRREISEAINELNSLEGYRGPGSEADPRSDDLTTENLFRGVVPGAQKGPHVSQLLWKDIPLGVRDVKNTIDPQPAGRDYMTTASDWLKVQKGVAPQTDEKLPSNRYTGDDRYVITGRDLAERVHFDPPFRQYQRAAQILIGGTQAPLDDTIPYTLPAFETQEGLVAPSVAAADNPNARDTKSPRNLQSFLSQTTRMLDDFGPKYVERLVVEVSAHASKAAFHKKWNVHRRLRPEEYGGRIHATRDSEFTAPVDYPIPNNLLRSEALTRTVETYGSFFLPQAYAEGSPTHPSYPAAHGVVSGACATVLKALFDESYVFKAVTKVFPTADGSELRNAREVPNSDPLANDHAIFDELTVGGELNKLAANVSLGRNFAGIHYRTDGIEGMRLGESVAIHFLADHLTTWPHDEITLRFESFDGEEVRITPTTDDDGGGSTGTPTPTPSG